MEWFQAVIVRWETLWFGFAGLAVLYVIRRFRWWKYQEKRLPWYMIGLVLLCFLLLSSYFAFEDKKGQFVAARSEIGELRSRLQKKKPDLKLGFYHAYWVAEYPLLIALVSISNAGEVPSIAHDFELSLDGRRARPLTDKPLSTVIFHLRIGAPPLNTDMVLLGNEFVEYKTIEVPIQQGRLVRGWVLFDLHEVAKPCSKPQTGLLYVRDVNNERYQVAIAPQSIPRLPPFESFHYPDMTSPWRQRYTADQMEKGQRGDVIMLKTEPCVS
jgi:hypothetical protein